ncbi:MAG TPA: endonuclease/exonuclease/phosphatase family protein [bacterium]|nr:endonuclease/exonuclease/phosphatase family protein [bacterium]
MRVATFNVENLFSRPVAMNYSDKGMGQPVLDDFHDLNTLLRKETYSPADKQEIERLCDKYKLTDRNSDHHEMVLREVRGKLWQQHQNGTRDWIATGSNDFLGWVELVYEAIDDRAIQNTAKVIATVNADIQIMVEVENRPTLQRFHDAVLKPELAAGQQPYTFMLLMEGNDERGINVGILSRMPVVLMKSNVELRNNSGHPLFARDCAQFFIDLGANRRLCIFANHLSSQGSDHTGKRRKEQADKVRELVDSVLKQKLATDVIVCGDMNEPEADGHLQALLNPNADNKLQDAMDLPQYPESAQFPGTYSNGTKSNKFDYLLMSKDLVSQVKAVGVERRGTYSSQKWTPFPTVTDERSQASDHHCLWADLS